MTAPTLVVGMYTVKVTTGGDCNTDVTYGDEGAGATDDMGVGGSCDVKKEEEPSKSKKRERIRSQHGKATKAED